MRLQTLAVHAGAAIDSETGAVAPPIHLSTTFEHGTACEETHGYSYIREKNPTQTRLEEALAQLEGGETSLAFASGMGAICAVMQSLPPGSHVIFPDDAYTGFRNLYREYLANWGIEHAVVDMTNLPEIRAAIRPNTKIVLAETPSNPMLKVTDLTKVAEITHAANADLLVDNTFATPMLQRPIEFGADIVLHSTTKYCGGHSDVQGGCLVLKSAASWKDRLYRTRMIMGAAASPFNSWLILRGLRSLDCRMERHSANAAQVAASLEASPKVERVCYPGLPSHPGHDLARRQMKLFGGMLSFQLKGNPGNGYDEALRVASRVKLFTNATSLGGTESLIEHRASSEGQGTKVPQNLLRVSVGLEHADDLIEDLIQALS
jgi:cystathionine gamma-synthase